MDVMSESGIISGPELKDPIPDCSVAEFFIPLIKKHPPENIIQLDATIGYPETSRDFLIRSLKVSLGYRKLGLGQDDVFCILSRNLSDAFAAVIGVFWLGGVIAPLDPDSGTFELKHMFDKIIRPNVVICEERILKNVTETLASTGRACKVIVLSDEKHESCLRFTDILAEDVDVDNYVPEPVPKPSEKIILVIPTSGSTGIPKGVKVTHKQMIFQALSLRQENKEYSYDSCMQTSYLNWITSFTLICISLTKGMTRIYTTERSPLAILNAIHKFKPEWILISPPFLSTLVIHSDVHKYDLSSLKLIALGGCSVNQLVLDGVTRIWGSIEILRNYYGASETSAVIARTERGRNLNSVGKLSAGFKAKIIDPETGKILGVDQRGEVYLTSPALMKGYLGLEKETKEALVDGWFRTGDFGYYDQEENLYLVDRLKQLIKTVRGPISPIEIENAILSIPGVEEVGVVGVHDDTVECYLVGLIVKKKESDVTEKMINDFVKENFAGHKQLRTVRFVESLPRSSTGKVQRKLLKEMAISQCK